MLLLLAGACVALGEVPSILCRILKVHRIDGGFESGVETHCELQGTLQQYPLVVPSSILKDYGPKLLSGDTFMRVSDAKVEGESLVTGNSSNFSVSHRHTRRHRHLVASTGVRSISVIRVSTTDKSPSASIGEMRNILRHDRVNVITQMFACSHGDLDLQSKGVHDVRLSRTMNQYPNAMALVNEAVDILRDNQIADHTLFCLPPGTPGDWIARANTNHWRSWYNDEWCTSLSAAMHEIGEY